MTYVRPNIYTNKQTSPIFNCVTTVSVSLATLARQQTFNSYKVFGVSRSYLLLWYHFVPSMLIFVESWIAFSSPIADYNSFNTENSFTQLCGED